MLHEATTVHTRLLRFTLRAEECQAYWKASTVQAPLDVHTAFSEYTFGQKSESRVEVTLQNLRARFDAFPHSLNALHHLRLQPKSVPLICHWHIMVADPLYRAFALWLQDRRELGMPGLTRAEVSRWTEQQQPGRWAASTRNGWGTKLLMTAREAGLVTGSRDPRTLALPYVTDEALLYLLHLLRPITHAGTEVDNAYLRSVGLSGGVLHDRLRQLTGVSLRRMGDLVDLTFDHADLSAWVESRT